MTADRPDDSRDDGPPVESALEPAPEQSATTRDADAADVPPPMTISGRGPMGQSVPDVASGSTPLTRKDD